MSLGRETFRFGGDGSLGRVRLGSLGRVRLGSLGRVRLGVSSFIFIWEVFVVYGGAFVFAITLRTLRSCVQLLYYLVKIRKVISPFGENSFISPFISPCCIARLAWL